MKSKYASSHHAALHLSITFLQKAPILPQRPLDIPRQLPAVPSHDLYPPYYHTGPVYRSLAGRRLLLTSRRTRPYVVPLFHQSRKNDLPNFMLARILLVLFTAVTVSGAGIVAHALLFGLARSIALPVLMKVPFVPRILRPFMAHFLRGAWSITLLTRHFTLILRAFFLGLMTMANWDFAESIFDSSVAEVCHSSLFRDRNIQLGHIAQPVLVAHTTADPALTLVSGIKSTDGYYKHFAYTELQQFAIDESPAGADRRKALFADQKHNPSMWSTLVRETLLLLGNDYQLFLRRGAPPPPRTYFIEYASRLVCC